VGEERGEKTACLCGVLQSTHGLKHASQLTGNLMQNQHEQSGLDKVLQASFCPFFFSILAAEGNEFNTEAGGG
jgi:hypothetical protein